MMPNKSHLQVIVIQLLKDISQLDETCGYGAVFNTFRTIFKPKDQLLLSEKLVLFQKKHIISSYNAQAMLESRKKGFGGSKTLRIYNLDGTIEKVIVNFSALKIGLDSVVVWGHKKVILLVKENDIQFDKIEKIDLEVKE